MSVYLEQILQRIPQVFSQIDREFFSLTYGSGDRVHWCWKFTDFPGARFQEFLFTLAWLYSTSTFDNPWKGNSQILKYIESGFTYWSKIQYRDGSFDEAYPFEHSLAATAFTLFYLTEAYTLMKSHLSTATQNEIEKTVRQAADWLCVNDEYHGVLSNHLAAAAAACLNAGLLTGKTAYKDRSNHFLNRIYEHQSSEGWYEEYGNADIGYQTHGSFYLSIIWRKTKDERLLNSLRLANTFISHFIHPDGSIGGEYASRDTMFFYPAAFEILNSHCQASRSIMRQQREKVLNGDTVGLPQMDAYNLYPVLNNYIFAHEAYCHNSKIDNIAPLPWEQTGEWKFSKAGLTIKSTPFYYAIIGAKKGGVIRVWDKKQRKLSYQSCGYLFQKGSIFFSNQALGTAHLTQSGSESEIQASFVKVNRKVFSPWLFLAFRLFTLTLGRRPTIAYWIKNLLVKTLIRKKNTLPLRLTRRLSFSENEIIIKDQISDTTVNVTHCDKFSTIHMGSSRYADMREEQIRGLNYPQARLEFESNGVLKYGKVTIS